MKPEFSLKYAFPLLIFLISFFSPTAQAQITTIPGPVGSGRFGASVTVLSNGNYVITDPGWLNGTQEFAGAVYLYNGVTHELISRLTGSSASDQIGSGGITPLTNGNFIVLSPNWSDDDQRSSGAVTWVDGTRGISGAVSQSNSLVGTNSLDFMWSTIAPLQNGNYVICSPNWQNGTAMRAGAVTWGDGVTGISGEVSVSNSLVGTNSYDQVGYFGITELTNGNYVVLSSFLAAAPADNGWAVTWGDGNRGVTGVISTDNSFTGANSAGYVLPLQNGNYLYINYSSNNGSIRRAGAVTWCDGTIGRKGVLSSENSLVGSYEYDQVGIGGVTLLNDDNYVVKSPSWRNGDMSYAGAVTWANGSIGISGEITPSNSLVGNTYGSGVGSGGVFDLGNGNILVSSPGWDGDLGAVTFSKGNGSLVGNVTLLNSLVGSSSGDRIGSNGITVLANGNYVVSSPNWNNGNASGTGAATWGSGSSGVVGKVTGSNSLIGTNPGDQASSGGVLALANGNYVVRSPRWNGVSAPGAGAVTWGNGKTGITGNISRSNSLTGSSPYDLVGELDILALSNGNYVLASPSWDRGPLRDAGAVTWADGTSGVRGEISSSNSLVGSTAGDMLGNKGLTALKNGNYIIASNKWSNGPASAAGAATWGDGKKGINGEISGNNSLIGSTSEDQIGTEVTPLPNGNYLVVSSSWDNGTAYNTGAVTWGNGNTGTKGVVSPANSLVGSNSYDAVGFGSVEGDLKILDNGDYVVRSVLWNRDSPTNKGAITFGSGDAGVTGPVNTCNSILGTVSNSGFQLVYNPVHSYLLAGYYPGNFYTIHNGSGLATSASATVHVDRLPVVFLSNCSPIAALNPVGAVPVNGLVTGKVYVEKTVLEYESIPMVRRHHDIAPASNRSNATGKVTLYYTQADFDDYNASGGSFFSLPVSPSDSVGKSNLRISQHHGNSNTGSPGSYSGWSGTASAIITIDPADEDIIWNNVERRWEVSFPVNGFSGFFAHSVTEASPVGYLFPNPAKQGTSVTIVAEEHVLKIEIFDVLGRKILETMNDNHADRPVIYVAGISRGVYLVRYTTTGGRHTRKLIVL